jgi:hypothetical protein
MNRISSWYGALQQILNNIPKLKQLSTNQKVSKQTVKYWSRVVRVSSTNHIPYTSDANVITPTLNIPAIITPILNTSTVTDSLCNSGAFSNPNAVRDCPFNLKGAWFFSRSLGRCCSTMRRLDNLKSYTYRPCIFAILNFEENMTGIEETK